LIKHTPPDHPDYEQLKKTQALAQHNLENFSGSFAVPRNKASVVKLVTYSSGQKVILTSFCREINALLPGYITFAKRVVDAGELQRQFCRTKEQGKCSKIQ
jgi:hypothetical protein